MKTRSPRKSCASCFLLITSICILFLGSGERVGDILLAGTAFVVRRVAHNVMDLASLRQFAMFQIIMVVSLSIDHHRLDIAARALASDCYLIAVLKMERNLVHIRRTDDVLVTTGTNRVES